MPSIRSGRDATACASRISAMNPPRVKISENGLCFAPRKNALPKPSSARPMTCSAPDITSCHDATTGDAPQHALLAVDERRRQHRPAGQRGAQRVARVERGLRSAIDARVRPPSAAVCAGCRRRSASRPSPQPTAASTHHQFAEYRLRHALASWSRTNVSSTASTTTATAMIAHRSHQYLPRAGPVLTAGLARRRVMRHALQGKACDQLIPQIPGLRGAGRYADRHDRRSF